MPPSGTPIWRMERMRLSCPGRVRGTMRWVATGAVAPYPRPRMTALAATSARLPLAAATSMPAVASIVNWPVRAAPKRRMVEGERSAETIPTP